VRSRLDRSGLAIGRRLREKGRAMTYHYKLIDSPVGELKLVASAKGLAAILWENDDPGRVRLAALVGDDAHPILVETARQLDAYFAGTLDRFDVPLDFNGTDFQKSVWAALLTIPFGETRSYGEIAGFPERQTFVTHLECSMTGERYEADRLHGLSAAGRPLLVRYDLEAAKAASRGTACTAGGRDLWRWREILPVRRAENIVSLGEIETPLVTAPRRQADRLRRCWSRTRAGLPTGSFKARGLVMAIAMAKELGVTDRDADQRQCRRGRGGLCLARGHREHRASVPTIRPRSMCVRSPRRARASIGSTG
jgi:hypothetical protein